MSNSFQKTFESGESGGWQIKSILVLPTLALVDGDDQRTLIVVKVKHNLSMGEVIGMLTRFCLCKLDETFNTKF